MGYFPNGSAGADYQERYCNRCVHDEPDIDKPGCPVWGAHLLHNYHQFDDGQERVRDILDMLIPRGDG